MRLNRRKETIIKLQNFLMDADDFSESSSDSDSSESSKSDENKQAPEQPALPTSSLVQLQQ